MKEYTIIVKTEKYGWCLHGLAGHDKAQAERRLEEERARFPELELALNEYTTEERADCWWNKYGTN